MTRRIPHLPIVLAALFAGAMFATPAPLGAPQPVIDIPVSTTAIAAASTVRAIASRDNAGAVRGAPAPKPSEHAIGGAATTTAGPVRAASSRPPAPALHSPRPTPRKEVRPAHDPVRASATQPGGHRLTLSGLASWYATGGPGMYGATHDYVDGTHVSAVVCAFPSGRARCLTIPVVTQCGACRWRKGATLIDLSDDAFAWFGVPLSVGVLRVSVELVA